MPVAVTGIVILAIAVLLALWQVRRSAPDQPRQVRVLRCMLYFWVLVFAQLAIAAIAYALLHR